MRGRIYLDKEKDEARRFIAGGKSYGYVSEKLGIPKSTLSVWFGKTLRGPMNNETVRAHLKRIRPSAAAALRKRFIEIGKKQDEMVLERVLKALKEIPFRNKDVLRALLAMLYWAEGSKRGSGIKFVNTDPDLMHLYISLLRSCYKINENKLKVVVHIHDYHSEVKVKNFWSQLLDIPLTQFNKTFIKPRSKTRRFRRNFMGICLLYYGDTSLRKEFAILNSMLKKRIVGA